VTKFFDILDRFKFGIIAAFAAYIGLFIYLQMESYTAYFPIEPFDKGSYVVIPEDEVKLKPENIEVPSDFVPTDVKNISRDQNDTRKRSNEKWFENKSASEVEQSVKDYEKKLFEEAGGDAKRKKIQQEIDERKTSKTTSSSKPKESTSQNGGNTAFAGSVMVDWSLANRNPHQNNNWYVRNPGYTCGTGASGKVSVSIKVNQNGDVISATANTAPGTNGCMVEQALKYAKLSRFNFTESAPKIQEGTIIYTFVSQ
jgi:hypothetical protein